jgi:hypothetical protein
LRAPDFESGASAIPPFRRGIAARFELADGDGGVQPCSPALQRLRRQRKKLVTAGPAAGKLSTESRHLLMARPVLPGRTMAMIGEMVSEPRFLQLVLVVLSIGLASIARRG